MEDVPMSWAETCTSKPNPAFLAIELVSSWTILAWMHGVECVTMEQDASIGEKHYVGGYIVKTTRKTGLGWWGKLKKSMSWKEWPSHLRLAHMSITPFGESRSLSLNKYLEIVELQNFFFILCVYLTEFELLNCRRESDTVAHWMMSLQGCKSNVVGGDRCTTTRKERAS